MIYSHEQRFGGIFDNLVGAGAKSYLSTYTEDKILIGVRASRSDVLRDREAEEARHLCSDGILLYSPRFVAFNDLRVSFLPFCPSIPAEVCTAKSLC